MSSLILRRFRSTKLVREVNFALRNLSNQTQENVKETHFGFQTVKEDEKSKKGELV